MSDLVSLLLLICVSLSPAAPVHAETVAVGSKNFTEGYILAEIVAQKLEHENHLTVRRRFGMGATGILFEALTSGKIHLYTEYTGTIARAILKRPELVEFDKIQKALKPYHLVMSRPLGFNNTYALAVPRAFAEKRGLRTISDLKPIFAKLRIGIEHEFLERADGLPGLARRYGLALPIDLQPMEHSLSYEAVRHDSVDLIDAYSTDAKIEKLDLTVLIDDLKFFPKYEPVILARREFVESHPEAWRNLQALAGTVDEKTMRGLNAEVDIDKKPLSEVAANYLGYAFKSSTTFERDKARVWQRTKEHTFLVVVALLFSILIGIPLGIVATHRRSLGQGILLFSGLVQTVPSLALLCFLVPLFGIGSGSALIALCLYGLLPVVMNTFVGLRSIDPKLIEMTHALGLTPWQALIRVRLPLASLNIMAGIKTSLVIGIGTATLAALIGAGGYGAIILSGLAINDTKTILLGAAPAAAMALGAHVLFEILSWILIPEGLK
jgi:osmoprotectant transport system permease protein